MPQLAMLKSKYRSTSAFTGLAKGVLSSFGLLCALDPLPSQDELGSV